MMNIFFGSEQASPSFFSISPCQMVIFGGRFILLSVAAHFCSRDGKRTAGWAGNNKAPTELTFSLGVRRPHDEGREMNCRRKGGVSSFATGVDSIFLCK